jgi:hypothetical protein
MDTRDNSHGGTYVSQWIERYLAGDRVRVWTEMTGLGDGERSPEGVSPA